MDTTASANNILSLRVTTTHHLPFVSADLTVSGWTLLILTSVAILLAVLRLMAARKDSWQAVEVEIPLGSIGKVKIKPNREVIQTAHKAWVELVTRKAGIPFEPDHDVIVEVYDSWYELFREFRLLAKQLPAESVRRSPDAKTLLDVLLEALNAGLRPHLTRWQAAFRQWYKVERDRRPEVPPQVLQREYPDYEALISDLLRVNAQMVQFAEATRTIAQG